MEQAMINTLCATTITKAHRPLEAQQLICTKTSVCRLLVPLPAVVREMQGVQLVAQQWPARAAACRAQAAATEAQGAAGAITLARPATGQSTCNSSCHCIVPCWPSDLRHLPGCMPLPHAKGEAW